MPRKKLNDQKTQQRLLTIWYNWLRGLPVLELASTLRESPKQVEEALRVAMQLATKDVDGTDTGRAEKVLAQLELVERHLWLLFGREERNYNRNEEVGDVELAQVHLSNCIRLLSIIKEVVSRKAELLRRMGMVPVAVERSAALIVSNQPLMPATAINLEGLTARVPERAPLPARLGESPAEPLVEETEEQLGGD